MALVRIRGGNQGTWTGRDIALWDTHDIIDLLQEQNGVRYGTWDSKRLPQELRGKATLTDEQKSVILDVYSREIDEAKKEGGYVAADVVALAPDNPKLDEICAKFDKEHTHDEDEVRFVVSGHGTFTVRGLKDEAIDITMGPGDYISVPRDRRHWFTLLADKTIVAVRVFQDTKGWTPHYAGTGTGPTEISPAELESAFGKEVVQPVSQKKGG